MSLVTCPCRKALASVPVRASFPRSERSTTKVVTDETLARLLQPGEPPPNLALQLVHHPVARDARLERRADDRRLLRAVEALEQRQQPFEIEREGSAGHVRSGRIMPLAEEFNEILDALPADWTDLALDLRVQEDRYIDAASLMVTCNAQPTRTTTGTSTSSSRTSSGTPRRHPWCARDPEAARRRRDRGRLVLREVREGRVEVTQMWGRPESVRQEFRRIRSQ